MQIRMDEVRLNPVATPVVCVGCMTVGGIGLLWRYPWPRAPIRQPPPVLAQVIHIDLAEDASAMPADIGASSPPPEQAAPSPPAMPNEAVAPAAPPLIPVATPSPSIAFAQPLETS